jgi:MFS family permease
MALRQLRVWVERLTQGFDALRIRNYRFYWFGQLVAFTGRWMQTTALAWLVIELTRSPLAIGLVTTFQFLPLMALSLFGGVIADRFPKHRLILIMQIAATIQALILGGLVLTKLITIELVYLLAFIQGVINAVDNPVRQTFVGEIIGRERLQNAVALNSMQFNIARIFGPAVAGVVVAQAGVAPALLISAVGFVGAAFSLLIMDRSAITATPPKVQSSVVEQLSEGISYAWGTPSVLLVLIIVAAIGTFGYNFTVVLPLLAGFVLKTDAVGLGTLSACMGAGSLAGAIGTTYARSISHQRLLIASAAFSILLGLTALTTNFALACGLLIILGFFGVTFATTANTLLQTTVPDALRGRVISIYILLFVGSTPIGAFLIGVLSNTLGAQFALLSCAILCLVGVAIGWSYQRRHELVSPASAS